MYRGFTSRCECPYGYAGPICDKLLFPACRLAPNATEMHCGERMPRSCECFRQCRQFYCSGGLGKCETPRDPWFVRCFERVNKPAAAAGNGTAAAAQAVYSDIPGEWEEKAGLVSWFRGMRSDMSRGRISRAQATKVSRQQQLHPLSHAPGWTPVVFSLAYEL